MGPDASGKRLFRANHQPLSAMSKAPGGGVYYRGPAAARRGLLTEFARCTYLFQFKKRKWDHADIFGIYVAVYNIVVHSPPVYIVSGDFESTQG
jgi:hypothetical protein